jgi:hypothetical protein
MGRRTLLALLIGAILAVAAGGCSADVGDGQDDTPPGAGTEGPPADPVRWAAAAQARFDAELAAAAVGVAEYVAFVTEDVQLEDLGWRRTGRDTLQRELATVYGPTFDELTVTRTAVDRGGAAVELTVDHLPGEAGPVELLEVRDYRSDGVAAVRTSWGLERARDHPTAVGAAAFAELEALAARYVSVWSGAVTAGLDDLYGSEARVVDDVVGLELAGRTAVADHLAARRRAVAADLRLATIPGTDVPAIYLDRWVAAAASHLTLVLDGDDGRGCPGRIVVDLELDAQHRVVAERRFHAIGAVRRCVSAPPDGWWDELEEPVGSGDETSEVRLGGRAVEVRGGSPGLQGLLVWAFERFETAGLAPPDVASVTFASATGRCEGIAGRVDPGRVASVDVLLCLDAAAACRDQRCTTYRFGARQTVLHELAHVWERTQLDEARRQRYRETTGLGSWMGVEVPWAERAGERAAEVLMWGLLDQPVPLVRLGDPPCEQLAAEYRQLTGTDPICGGCPGS